MILQPGQMLSHYRLVEKIGEGGMGVVWKALDTTLDRQVAIKLLPESFAADGDRLARFSREAKLLASLSHPHIAAVYGLHEESGIRFLAMELMAGEDLTRRLARGPVPVKEAVEMAAQIAAALEEAHDKGIVHRDLKPANVMLLPDGTVKVLDFGLAKALGAEQAGGSGLTDPSLSPTLTAAMGTQAGLILGTAAYMSPEQARGKPVGRRADVWAFGVVLFEMLTGKRLFSGETATDVIAAVVTREPDWSELPASTPASVRRLLRRCLEKDPRRRLRDLGDARLELAEPYDELDAASTPSPEAAQGTPRRLTWPAAAAGLIVGLALAAIFLPFLRSAPEADSRRATWSNLLPPDDTPYLFEHFLEISPDGRYVAFVGAGGGDEPLIWIRDLETEQARPLTGTDGATMPFWSPDSRSIGFFAEQRLRSIRIEGGVPTVIARAGLEPRGGSWAQDDTILFVPNWSDPVYRVPAAGGTPQQVTTFEESRLELSHRWPQALPDGRHFLYYVVSTYPELNPENPSEVDKSGLYLGSLDGSPARPLLEARSRASYDAGSLLYVDDGILMARPFSLDSLSFQGPATPLAENVTQSVTGLWGGALFSVADEGSLLFVRGAPEQDAPSQLVWRDRQGRDLGSFGEPASYNEIRLAHDSRRAALSMGDPGDIWTIDFERQALTRFTFDPGNDISPRWSPDDDQVIFMSSRVLEDSRFSPASLFTKRISGLENDHRLLSAEGRLQVSPSDWSPDGRDVLLVGSSAGTGVDILVYSMEDNTIRDLLRTEHEESAGRFSPDGKWIVYQSDESGRIEIYVQAYPLSGGKWQISRGGGFLPSWSADGSEIFYLSAKYMLMAVPVFTDDGFRSGTPQPLFQTRVTPLSGENYCYDVAADGRRFLLMEIPENLQARPTSVTLVRNWPARLGARIGQAP